MILTPEHAELNLAHAANRYRPSNGTEGELFQGAFCAQCVNLDEHGYCEILMRMYSHDTDEPEYPVELVHDYRGQPTCTTFRYLRQRERFDDVLDEISGISTRKIDGEVAEA